MSSAPQASLPLRDPEELPSSHVIEYEYSNWQPLLSQLLSCHAAAFACTSEQNSQLLVQAIALPQHWSITGENPAGAGAVNLSARPTNAQTNPIKVCLLLALVVSIGSLQVVPIVLVSCDLSSCSLVPP